MRHIRDRYKTAKATHKKSKQELRSLRSFMASHYTLLALSSFDVLLACFAMAETDAPWKPAMLAISGACFLVGLYILLSSIEK